MHLNGARVLPDCTCFERPLPFGLESCQLDSNVFNRREGTIVFQKILLAYDRSEHTVAALGKAAELAQLCQAELHLLGVKSTISTAAMLQVDTPYPWFAEDEQQIDAALARAKHELGDRGLTVETSIRQGSPAQEIASHAHEIQADLAIIGHSDKGFVARLFEGSIGAALVRDLPCNLLVVTDPH